MNSFFLEEEKAGAVWVIGVSAPAVVTGIYKQDDLTGFEVTTRSLILAKTIEPPVISPLELCDYWGS
jgi:hypothetical protein